VHFLIERNEKWEVKIGNTTFYSLTEKNVGKLKFLIDVCLSKRFYVQAIRKYNRKAYETKKCCRLTNFDLSRA